VGGSVISAAGTALAYAAADVYALKGALPPRYRPNASWVANEQILLLTRQFASGTGPQHAFWADFGMATPSQLLGRPVYESSAMGGTPLVDAEKILLCGDFKNGFCIVDRIGMTVQYEPLVIGTNRMPTGEVGWFAHWRVGSGVLNADAFRLLKVHTS
jgi:HK97 family phage major capsid protein